MTRRTVANEFTILQTEVGLLYEDGAFVRILPAGRHAFKGPGLFGRQTIRDVTLVDMRERSLTIKGQEITTADKVAIRVSLLVYFRVRDPAAAIHQVASYEERIYEDVQMAARRYMASKGLEAILTDRNGISDAVREEVKGPATGYGVEILRADLKDLVFPGNLREIMNQVLETERRAEAKLIEARKQAEADAFKHQTESDASIRRLESEKLQISLRAEAEQTAVRAQLASEIEQAQAMAQHPELLRLKQLTVLRELARAGGGKFVIGLPGIDLGAALGQEKG